MTIKGRYLVAGVGLNDSLTPTSRRVDGKMVHSPCYKAWHNMLNRCYSGKDPTYHDVTVCEEWHTYTNFESWWNRNNVPGYVLDKDLRIPGNKVYSPATCLYIPVWMNTIIRKNIHHLRGVSFDKNLQRYKTQGEIRPYYGYHDTEIEAHQCWYNNEGYLEKERLYSLDIYTLQIFLKWSENGNRDIYAPHILKDILNQEQN